MARRKLYIHTLNGRVAAFSGDQICYVTHFARWQKAATSLAQIRREQLLSTRYRQEVLGVEEEDGSRYGYRILYMESPDA